MKKNIYFIRHGTTKYNEENRVQGAIDICLSSKGYKDIENIKYINKTFDKYYHSSLSRSRDTLYGYMKNNNIELKNIIENDLIIERGYGIFEGLTRQNIKDKYPNLYKEWLENENITGFNIESVNNVIIRIKKFIKNFINSNNSNILAVTHSGVLYALYKYIFNLPLYLKPEEMDIKFENGCVICLEIEMNDDETKFNFIKM